MLSIGDSIFFISCAAIAVVIYMHKFHPKKQYIICAAIWIDDGKKWNYQPKNIETGMVICGRRHHNCIHTYYNLSSNKPSGAGIVTQGFMTNDSLFVDREQALKIATKANQLNGSEPVRSNELFSENLY